MALTAPIGRAALILSTDSAEFDKGLETAKGHVQRFDKDLQRFSQGGSQGFEQMARSATGLEKRVLTMAAAGGAAIGALAANIIGQGVRSLEALAREAFDSAGQIVDLSKKTGLSTKTIQQMQFVAGQTGGTLEQFSDAAYKLGLRLAGGAGSVQAAAAALGIEWGELKKQSPDEQFKTVVDALGQVEDATKRNELGTALFGKTFSSIAGAVADNYSAMAKGAKVSTDAQLKEMERLGDEWDAWVAARKASLRGFLGELALQSRVMARIRMAAPTGPDPRGASRRGEQFVEMQRILELNLQDMRQTDIELSTKAAAAQGSYAQQLAKVRGEIANLTTAQRAEIDAAQQLGVSTDELEDKYGLTDGALKLLTRTTAAAAAPPKTLATEVAALMKWVEGLNSAWRNKEGMWWRDFDVDMRRLTDYSGGMERMLAAMREIGQAHEEAFVLPSGTPSWWKDLTLMKAPNPPNDLPLRQAASDRAEALRERQREMWRGIGDQLKAATAGRLGSLFFGNLGHDPDGSLKAAAREAELVYLRLQRSGRATAQELKTAFDNWREAEDRANFSFGERFKQFWGGIKQTFVTILDEMLQHFVTSFIGGMVKSMFSAKLGQRLADMLSPGGLPGLPGGAPGGGPDGGPPGGPGPWPWLAKAPWSTIGSVAAAAAFGTLAWRWSQRGLFRGGEQALQVNPARDAFWKNFGDGNKARGEQFVAAELAKTRNSGLFAQIQAAKTMADFNRIAKAILAILRPPTRYPNKRITLPTWTVPKAPELQTSFARGGFIPPGITMPAMLHGGRRGELVVPLDRAARGGGQEVHVHHTVNLHTTIRAVDGADARRVFDEHMAPWLKRELFLNTHGLETAIRRAVVT